MAAAAPFTPHWGIRIKFSATLEPAPAMVVKRDLTLFFSSIYTLPKKEVKQEHAVAIISRGIYSHDA